MNTPGTGIDPQLRKRARRRAVQAIYAWQISGNDMAAVVRDFAHEQDMEQADLDYFNALTRGVEEQLVSLDERLTPLLDRTIEQVDPIERAILRLAAFELLHRPDVPYRVSLNEAIELAKRFGSDQGHTYINGVLDQAAREWRADEYRR
jgi:N utilization substance protein B